MMVHEGEHCLAEVNNNSRASSNAGHSHIDDWRSLDEVTAAYSKWARCYDKDHPPGVYNGPEIAAAAMLEYYQGLIIPHPGISKIKILDIAAGTGLVGKALARKGFKTIDALDASQGMLDVLKEEANGIYGRVMLNSIGIKPVVEVRADTYDALIMVGGMGEGYIPVRALDEMLRIVKKDGMMFMVLREDLLTMKEYKKLEPFMERLVFKGLMIQVSKRIVPKYSFEHSCIIYILQKL